MNVIKMDSLRIVTSMLAVDMITEYTVIIQVYCPASDSLREEKERVGPVSDSTVPSFLHW